MRIKKLDERYGAGDQRSHIVDGMDNKPQEVVIRLIVDQPGATQHEKIQMPAKEVDIGVSFRTRHIRARETFYRDGDSADSIFIIESGMVKTFVVGKRGEPTEAHVYRKGDILGELALINNVRYNTAMAMEDTAVREYPVAEIWPLVSSNPTAVSLIRSLSQRIGQLYDRPSGDTRIRLIIELIEAAKRDGAPSSGGMVFMGSKYTHELLAARIERRREVVTVHMQSLKDKGAVEMRADGMYLNPAVLEKLLTVKKPKANKKTRGH